MMGSVVHLLLKHLVWRQSELIVVFIVSSKKTEFFGCEVVAAVRGNAVVIFGIESAF